MVCAGLGASYGVEARDWGDCETVLQRVAPTVCLRHDRETRSAFRIHRVTRWPSLKQSRDILAGPDQVNDEDRLNRRVANERDSEFRNRPEEHGQVG